MMDTVAPVSTSQRLFTMDVIRGVAVLGILTMNIAVFSGNEFQLAWNDVFAHKLTLNGFIFKSELVLFGGKMRGLFTILFGAGLILFIANKKENSISVADAYMRRMMWLLLFGIIDGYLLLWSGDVLYEYALCGLFLFAFRNLRVRYMMLVALLAIGIFTIKTGTRYSKYRAESVVYLETSELIKKGKVLTEEQKKIREDFEAILQRHFPMSQKVVEEIRNNFLDNYIVYHSGYPEIFEKQAEEIFESQSKDFYSGFYETFGTIMLGMALFKVGFFEYRLKLSTYRLFCFVGIPIGIALSYLSFKLQVKTQAELWNTYSWRPFSTVYLESPSRIILIIAYASAVMLLCRIQLLKNFLTLFSNTGRMALTNYIMQTVICSYFFYGFGLGHYAGYNALHLLIFIVCVWIFQIIFSTLYLRRFNMGPVEWVWKKLTYGRLIAKVPAGN